MEEIENERSLNELIIFLFCGVFLVVVSFFVFKDWILNISFSKEDLYLLKSLNFVVHFLTCFLGVTFFFILFKRFSYGLKISVLMGVVLMIITSFLKEVTIDNMVSISDVFWNFLGVWCGYLIVKNKKEWWEFLGVFSWKIEGRIENLKDSKNQCKHNKWEYLSLKKLVDTDRVPSFQKDVIDDEMDVAMGFYNLEAENFNKNKFWWMRKANLL